MAENTSRKNKVLVQLSQTRAELNKLVQVYRTEYKDMEHMLKAKDDLEKVQRAMDRLQNALQNGLPQ